MMPGPWDSDDDSVAGHDDYPGDSGPVRPPGSRPLAELLTGPLAIVAAFIGVPLLLWLLWIIVFGLLVMSFA